MNIFKQPIFLGILAVALIITLILSFVSKKDATQTGSNQSATSGTTAQPESNLTTADPSDYDDILKTELAAATKFAIEFNPDYKISVVEVEIGASLQPETINTRYAFSTAKDIRNNWVYTTSQDNGSFLRALIPKADYLGDIVPINMSLWKYNYIPVLQMVDKTAGKDWRSKNTLTGIKMTLKESADLKNLYWTVEYLGDNGNSITVVDATTLIIAQQ